MKYVSPLLIFLIISAVILVVLLKTARKNNLLPPFSLKWWKERNRVEGETVLTWVLVPPLWKRILCLSIAVALPLCTFVYLTYFRSDDESRLRVAGATINLLVVGTLFALQSYRPTLYRVTDVGIWLKRGRIFGDPEKSSAREERYVMWKDVERMEFAGDKIILHKNVPNAGDSYGTARWIPGFPGRARVPIPEGKSHYVMKIREVFETRSVQ
jgi:hypothetical protein